MRIKEVIIEGFKTYKTRTVIGPFDPKHNAIVGRNGSGKSNVFDALQFVLSDKYTSLSAEDKQRLLHEGSGREIVSSSVEVVFDNSDNRFPVEEAEVSIKRTIGLKKDEYVLNSKHTTRSDVVSLLESAGLSRSNPYYIVEQGRVAALLKMKDEQRLALLKEIAGTRTYDERRRESMLIMEDTKRRRQAVQEAVRSIEKRLEELGEEKTELQEYQRLDNQRRGLEYAIFDHELRQAMQELDTVELAQRDLKQVGRDEKDDDAAVVAEKRRAAEEELKSTQAEVTMLQSQQELAQEQRKQLIQERTKAELAAQDRSERVERQKQQADHSQKELKQLSRQIEENERRLRELADTHNQRVQEEERARTRVELLEQRRRELLAKMDRSARFSSKRERDEFLRAQIAEVDATLSGQRAHLQRVEKQKHDAEQERARVEASIARGEEALRKSKAEMEACIEALKQLNEQRVAASNARKETWEKLEAVTQKFAAAERELRKSESSLQATMDKSTARGLAAVRRIVEREKISGCHGALYELFTCDRVYDRAVEATAGNRLFHVVVDNDEIAARILEALKDEQGGRVTLMPLAQLRAAPVNYPNVPDAFPMLQRLRFNERVAPAMRQVFGRTLVAENLEAAANVAHAFHFDAITIEGDQVSKKGALTGGYAEHKATRLALHRQGESARAAFEAAQRERDTLEQQQRAHDQEVTRCTSEIQKQGAHKGHLRNTIKLQQDDLAVASRSIALLRQQIEQYDAQIRAATASVSQLEERVATLRAELASPLVKGSHEQEHKQLAEMQAEIELANEALLDAQRLRADAEGQRREVESLLHDNLLKRRDELRRSIDSAAGDDEAGDAQQVDLVALADLRERIEELERRLARYESGLESKNARVRELTAQIDELRAREAEKQLEFGQRSKEMERLMTRRLALLQKVEAAQRSIRDLGSLPAGADEFLRLNAAELMRQLDKVNAKLKKYAHVNKRAIEQWTSFTQQREELLRRLEEADRGHDKILGLIKHLDNKKDEAIQRTFKQIAKHFSTVFAELVRGGKATLVMHTRLPATGDPDADGAQQPEDEEEEATGAEEDAVDDGGGEVEDADDGKEAVEASRGGRKRTQGKHSGKAAQRAKKSRAAAHASTAAAQAAGALAADSYTGVSIKVSFTGSDEGVRQLAQLSGGQQTVVALSLVFAIQRCDPSPFYLFDEIDSNLDAVHRTAVANMIRSQSPNAQFITTTFRPELLAHADKFFLVSFENKTSNVSVVDREEAMRTVAEVARSNAA
jgi:structural maintenance of chromosome 3 (chondroitin sulfate proteoglycan 6)